MWSMLVAGMAYVFSMQTAVGNMVLYSRWRRVGRAGERGGEQHVPGFGRWRNRRRKEDGGDGKLEEEIGEQEPLAPPEPVMPISYGRFNQTVVLK